MKFLQLSLTFLSLICGIVCSEQVQNCGGTYSGYQYTITSPNYPKHPAKDLNCVYTLAGNKLLRCETIFYLQFLDFDLPATENCSEEYLRVGDRHIFCGATQKLKKFMGQNGLLQLVYHSSRKTTSHRGFKILVTADCATNYEIARRNRSEIFDTSQSGNFSTVSFYEGNIDLSSKTDEKLSNNPKLNKKDISTYFFFPPVEKANITKPAIKLSTNMKDQSHENQTQLSQRNFDFVKSEREPLAFNPDCEQPSTELDTSNNSRWNSGLYSTVSGQNQGSFNNYNPNYDNSYNPNYENNYNPNNNFVSINPYPANPYPNYPDYPSVNGINSNYPFATDSECCGIQYSAPRFLIASPGFPNLGFYSTPFSCGYTIQKSSPQVCQLRLNFKFFNLGSDDAFCNNGYIDIEGQRFCGCRTGFSIVTPFYNFATKRLNVRSIGIPRSKFSGFLIEVVQENCNYNYRFKKEISQENDKREKRQLGYYYGIPNKGFIQGHFNHQFNFGNHGRTNFANSCQARVFFDWVLSSKEAYLRNARCQPSPGLARNNFPLAKLVSLDNHKRITKSSDLGNCEILDGKKGMLSSPGYPASYVDNIQKCYSIQKQKGFYKLEISIFDFDLEPSKDCNKDFVEFSGQNKRFCGQTLIGQKLSFDLTKMKSVQITFKSDSSGNGRGYSMAYEQVLY